MSLWNNTPVRKTRGCTKPKFVAPNILRSFKCYFLVLSRKLIHFNMAAESVTEGGHGNFCSVGTNLNGAANYCKNKLFLNFFDVHN